MNQLFSRLGIALVATLALAGYARADDTLPQPAPAWHLRDIAGNDVSSAQFKGKVLVINFWATWCPPCLKELPGYVRLQTKYRSAGLEIVGIALDDAGPPTVRRTAQKNGLNYTIAMGSWDLATTFGVTDRIPVTVIVDRDGIMRLRDVGYRPTEKFEKELLPFLAPPD